MIEFLSHPLPLGLLGGAVAILLHSVFVRVRRFIHTRL